MRGRYADLDELGEEDRENKLEVKTVEYLVHGIFARSEKGMGEGKNGLPGAFWFDLDKILATITEEGGRPEAEASGLRAGPAGDAQRGDCRRAPAQGSRHGGGWLISGDIRGDMIS